MKREPARQLTVVMPSNARISTQSERMPALPAGYRKKESYGSKSKADRAMLPFDLAYEFGMLCQAGFASRA